jgi:putative hydrolase of the HAD superfamily
MIRALTFDATGTLFTPRDVGGTYARVLSRHGVGIEPAEVVRLLPEVWREFACAARPERDRFASHPDGARGFWRDVVVRVCLRAGSEPPPPFAVAELFETFARADAWRLYPEVVATLDALAALGLRLAVVSNWDERLPRLISALGLAPRFEAIVVSQSIGVEKPHPAIFRAALERLGVSAEETVHIGDRRLEDVEGAEAAGLHALWLARSGGGDLDSLSALPGRLEALARTVPE